MSSLRPNPVKSTPLRDHMMREMQLHRLAPGTQKSYAKAITDLAKYYWRPPDQLTPDDIRAYLHHFLEERKLAFSTCNVSAAAIRFFHIPPDLVVRRFRRALIASRREDLQVEHPVGRG